MRTWTNKTIGFVVTGLIFILLGLFVSIFSGIIFNMVIKKEFALRPDSKIYDLWKNNSQLPPMYLEFYFFNWTNPEELKDRDKKPNFVQTGPYVFRELREKVNVTFHPNNHTVSYMQRKFWYFDEIRSNGTLQDEIVHLNIVVVSAAYTSRFWTSRLLYYLTSMLDTSELHIKKTVDELLFTGYDHPLLSLAKLAPPEMKVPPFNRFGWFYKRNQSTDFDGLLNMATGTDDIQNLGVLKNWNNQNTTSFYQSPCNAVGGSAGDFWPPFRTENDVISLFSPDLCRKISLEYMKKVSHFGVEGYNFALDSKTLGAPDNGMDRAEKTTEENCYCDGECTPWGLLNVSACRYGAPAFVSLPHFHKADPILRQSVNGMNPNDEDHSFYMTLEPNTAVPLQVAARLQVNILLQPSQSVSKFSDVPKIYFPVLWFSMKVEIPKNLTKDLQFFTLVRTLIFGTGILVIVIGILMIFGVISAKCKYRYSCEKVNNNSGKRMELIYLEREDDDEPAQKLVD